MEKYEQYEIIYDHDDEIFIIGEYDSADHDLSVDMIHKVMNKIAYINGWGNWDWKDISLRRKK